MKNKKQSLTLSLLFVSCAIQSNICFAEDQLFNKSFIINYETQNKNNICMSYYESYLFTDQDTDLDTYTTNVLFQNCNDPDTLADIRFYLRDDDRVALSQRLSSDDEPLCVQMFIDVDEKLRLGFSDCGSSDSGQRFIFEPVDATRQEYFIKNHDYPNWCLNHIAALSGEPEFSQCNKSDVQKFKIGLINDPIRMHIKNYNTGDQNADITLESPTDDLIYKSEEKIVTGLTIAELYLPSPWSSLSTRYHDLYLASRVYNKGSIKVAEGDRIQVEMKKNGDLLFKQDYYEPSELRNVSNQLFKLTHDQPHLLFYKDKISSLLMRKASALRVFEEPGFSGKSAIYHLSDFSSKKSEITAYRNKKIGSIKLIKDSGRRVQFLHKTLDAKKTTPGDITVHKNEHGLLEFNQMLSNNSYKKIGPYQAGYAGAPGDIYAENPESGVVRFYMLTGEFTKPFSDGENWISLPINNRHGGGIGVTGDIFVERSSDGNSNIWMLRDDGYYDTPSENNEWTDLGLIRIRSKINMWDGNNPNHKGVKGELFFYDNPHYSGKREYWMLNKAGAYGYFPTNRQSTQEWIYWGLADDFNQGVRLYDEIGLGGDSVFITDSVPDLGHFNDKMSSFAIPGIWTVRFFTGLNYSGKAYTRGGLNANASDITNAIKSIQIISKS